MKKTCVWCRKVWETGDEDVAEVITHNTCQDCIQYFFLSQDPVPLNEYLNRLGPPVLLMDDDVRVLGFNEQARTLFGKGLKRVRGLYYGDVIECAGSRLPGGCGKTERCGACAIRRAVTDTHATGRPHLNVVCYQEIQTFSGVRKLRFAISTEKAGDFVLLRIDEGRADRR